MSCLFLHPSSFILHPLLRGDMADLNEGTRQRNLRQLSGNAAVPSSNLREESGSVVVRGTPTDIIQAMGGRIGGWTIQNGMLTADGGNVKLNSYVPSISLGSATAFATGTGIWEGNEGGVYKWRVGDPAGHLISWDGSTLSVNGAITATAGNIGGWTIGTNSISAGSGKATISSADPSIKLGDATGFFTGAGFFVGESGSTYSLHIGDPSGNYVKYDGSTGALTMNGTVTTNSINPALQSFTTNIIFSSTDNNTVSWAAGTIRLASGVTYSISAGNTGDMAALTYIFLDTSVSTTVLQTTTNYSNAVGDNRLLLAAAQNHAAGASVIPYTGQQPIINGTDQIAALSIVAGNIASGAVTAGKISVTTLAAIQANIGAATISDVLTIAAAGGIYQGTGTFASPTTGLKVWNDGGVGRLATYLSGTPQVYFDTSGKLNAGGGGVALDASGISLAAGTGDVNSVLWRNSGAYLGAVTGYITAGVETMNWTVGSTIYKTAIRLRAHPSTDASRGIDFYVGQLVTPEIRVLSTGVYVEHGINVGSVIGATTGEIKTSGDVEVGGTLLVGGLSWLGTGANQAAAGSHIGTTTAVHGLGTAVHPVGSKQAGAMRLEYASGSASVTNGNWADITVTWANAFSAISNAVASVRCSTGGQYGAVKSYSTTGCVVCVYNGAGGPVTVYVDAIGIGT
jgi:hypothetical protein